MDSPTTPVSVSTLADGSSKTYSYTPIRKQLEVTFATVEEKKDFGIKMEQLKSRIGAATNKDIFNYLFEKTDVRSTECLNATSESTDSLGAKYGSFICENSALLDLVETVSTHRDNCTGTLRPITQSHCGHVGQFYLICENGHSIHWQSSKMFGKYHSVNYKMMLAYYCSGMSEVNFDRFTDFLDAGVLSRHFQVTVAVTFTAIIAVLVMESMRMALFEEVQRAREQEESGISIMTDARHQCRKNSYHTDHVALGQHTHKVINYQHITKLQERVTQRHEQVGCEQMYEYFKNRTFKLTFIHTTEICPSIR